MPNAQRPAPSASSPIRVDLLAVIAVSLCASLVVVGCGKKGPPSPPRAIVPTAADDLVVLQRGEEFVLEFAYPQTTTSGEALPGLAEVRVLELALPVADDTDDAEPPTVAEREFAAAARPVATVVGAELAASVSGDRVVVRLPASRVTGGGELSLFAVRTVAEGGGPSALSNRVAIVPRPAPPPPDRLSVGGTAEGVEVTWSAPDADVTGYHVYRRPARARSYGTPVDFRDGGVTRFVDESAEFGVRYIYTVTTVAARDPIRESRFGEEEEIEYLDRYPPAPPVDLVALPQQGAVRLVWRPSPAADVVGYIVERRDPGGEYRIVTEEPLDELKYTDDGLASDLTYEYRVRAVDEDGNEGDADAVVATPR